MRIGPVIGFKEVWTWNLYLFQTNYRLLTAVIYQIGLCLKLVWKWSEIATDLFQTNYRLPIAAISKENLVWKRSEIGLKHQMFQTCFRPVLDPRMGIELSPWINLRME